MGTLARDLFLGKENRHAGIITRQVASCYLSPDSINHNTVSFVIICEHNSTDLIEVKAIVKRSYQHHAPANLAACCANFRTSTFSVSSVSGTYFIFYLAQ